MRRRSGLFTLTATAILAALAVVFAMLGGLLPTVPVSAAALAGLCPMTAYLIGGRRAALMCWVAAGILCLLIPFTGEAGLMFAFVFGPYPAVKYTAERWKSKLWVWAAKLMYAHLALGLLLGASMLFFPDLFVLEGTLWLLWAMYAAVFVVYDQAIGIAAQEVVKRLKIDKS